MARWDVIVVGMGAVGAAALYQLARLGVRVLGLDRHAPPHDLGSHGGESRVTRLSIGEGADYLPLVKRSHEIWRELEAATGRALLHQVGCLVIANAGDVAGHGVADFYENTVGFARAQGIAHETLSGAEVRRRFPQFSVPDDARAYFEPEGGWVDPGACIAAQLEMAARHGAELRTGVQVIALSEGMGGVRVDAAGEVFEADQVLVTAGAAIPTLVGGAFAQHLTVTRQAMHWFRARPDLAAAWSAGPSFIWLHGPSYEQLMYGFPAIGGRVKIAGEGQDRVDPEAYDRVVPASAARDMYDDHAAGRLEGLEQGDAVSKSCLYTVQPEARFVIDRHPALARVLVASACSGHGFKHSAGLGEALAMRLVGEPGFDLSVFGIDRL